MKKKLLILFFILFFLVSCAKTTQAPLPTDTSKPTPQEKPEAIDNEDNIYKQFVNKLTKDTIDKKLVWDNVFNITREYDADAFNYILTSNEFHTVYELQSYGHVDEDGLTIFLLNEELESGMDGSIVTQKNLYILKGIDGESMKVPIEEKDLEDLESKIKFIFETEGADLEGLNNLIKEYLEN